MDIKKLGAAGIAGVGQMFTTEPMNQKTVRGSKSQAAAWVLGLQPGELGGGKIRIQGQTCQLAYAGLVGLHPCAAV